MDHAPLPDLDNLDRGELLSLVRGHQEELASLIAARDEQIRRLEAELDSHRVTLSQQADELRSRSEHIEHLKLTVEKLRHVIFGTKSEKIVVKLEQMELQLEEDETTHAELEAGAERVAPAKERKPRPERKPLQSISRGKSQRTRRPVIAVRTAVASCGILATMSQNNSSTFPRASRLSAMCGRSSPARAAITSSKRRHHHARSSAVLPVRAYLPM